MANDTIQLTKQERDLVTAFRRTSVETQTSTIKLLQGMEMQYLQVRRRSKLIKKSNQPSINVVVKAEAQSITGKSVIEETIEFDKAIDDATMAEMEQGATSKERGLARRYALLAMARDAKMLAKLSLDNPEAYGEMRDAVEDFKVHAQALLDVAEAASLRMSIADCRGNG